MLGKLILIVVGVSLVSENISLNQENRNFRADEKERGFTKYRAKKMMEDVEELDAKILRAIEGVNEFAGKSIEERAEIVAGFRTDLDRKLREIIRWQHNAL